MRSSGSNSSGMLRAVIFFFAFATAIALIVSMFVLAFDEEPAAALPAAAAPPSEADLPPATDVPSDVERLSVGPLRTVTICVDGAEMAVDTAEETVSAVLSSEGIALGPLDEVSPHGANPVYDGLKISVIRVQTVRFESEIEIAFDTETQNSESLYIGETKTLVEGVNGVKKLVFEQTIRDGVMIENKIISSEIVSDPVTRVIQVGTKPLPVTTTAQTTTATTKITTKATTKATTEKTTPKTTAKTTAKTTTTLPSTVMSEPEAITVTAGGITYEVSQVINGESVAYYSNRANPSTATGNPAIPGQTVAVDPDVIPLGSLLYITSVDGTSWSYGPAYAHDVGGGIQGNIVDLFKSSYAECIAHGRRDCIIYILKP